MNFQAGVASHLEKARRELLDLTIRNRLLNVPRKSKTAKLVEVQDELSSEVFRLLAREGKSFTFLAGNESEIDADSADYDDPNFAPLPQPGDDEADARGIAKRHSDTRLQTALTSKALQKRLLSMFYDARTAQEEMGINVLFLAMGFLRWYEDDKSETERWAPLLLVPVSLERQSAADRFKLKSLPEDIAENLSLATKLDAEFGLKLPPLPDQDDLDLETYFSSIAQSVAGMSRWEVRPNDIVLGFFSFSKLLMFRDLDAANWPDGSKIDLNATVAGLLRDGFDRVEGLIGEDEQIDPHIPPAQMVHVVDADSSQSLVIEEVRRGRHLVVQGPPGTGKSQTIANLVATAVASGKTVLFVAEKMAALDVVKRRLETIGLDADFPAIHHAGTRVCGATLERGMEVVEAEEALIGGAGKPFRRDAADLLTTAGVNLEGRGFDSNIHALFLSEGVPPLMLPMVKRNQAGMGKGERRIAASFANKKAPPRCRVGLKNGTNPFMSRGMIYA